MKGLAVGVIIGLVIGFSSGILYKNLSATAPVAIDNSVSSSDLGVPFSSSAVVNFASWGQEEDISGDFGNQLMVQIGVSLIDSIKDLGDGNLDRGLTKLIGEQQPTSSLPLNINLADAGIFLSEKLFPTAKAQQQIIDQGKEFIDKIIDKKTRQCTDEEVIAQSPNLNNWFNNYVTEKIFKDNVCIESAKVEGKVWMMIHQRMTTTGSQTFLEFKFDGKLIVTYWVKPNPDAECEKRTMEVAAPKQGGILITKEIDKPDEIKFFPSNNPPSGFAKVCQKGNIGVDLTIRNPKFNKDKCCSSVTGTGGSGY